MRLREASIISQGKLVGSRGAEFRKTSTSKPDEWRDSGGLEVGAMRNFAHEKAARDRAAEEKKKKEKEVAKRTKDSEKRWKAVTEDNESSGTKVRRTIRNVGRPDDAEPTSPNSKLSKTTEIVRKIIEEKLANVQR
jgi:hypothetical protein